MSGFIVLKSDALADQVATGEAIMRVAKSAFNDSPTSEWKKFNDDTRAWLYDNGYRYTGPGETPDGRIPASVEIVPVYDTPNRMHVKIPWHADLENPPVIANEPSYGNSQPVRFKVLLARYFVRKCR